MRYLVDRKTPWGQTIGGLMCRKFPSGKILVGRGMGEFELGIGIIGNFQGINCLVEQSIGFGG